MWLAAIRLGWAANYGEIAMRHLLWLLALTGCAMPASISQTKLEPYHITNYAARPLDPTNCGTPDDPQLCGLSPAPRPKFTVRIEVLDDDDIPPMDVVISQQ